MPGSSERLSYIEQDDGAKELLAELGLACSRLPFGPLTEVPALPSNSILIDRTASSGVSCYLVEAGTTLEEAPVTAKEVLTITFGKQTIFGVDFFKRESDTTALRHTVLFSRENHEMIHPAFVNVIETYRKALGMPTAAQSHRDLAPQLG